MLVNDDRFKLILLSNDYLVVVGQFGVVAPVGCRLHLLRNETCSLRRRLHHLDPVEDYLWRDRVDLITSIDGRISIVKHFLDDDRFKVLWRGLLRFGHFLDRQLVLKLVTTTIPDLE